jgi:hypothetical protein
VVYDHDLLFLVGLPGAGFGLWLAGTHDGGFYFNYFKLNRRAKHTNKI